eukprot:3810463-Amphidinium_carterae.1
MREASRRHQVHNQPATRLSGPSLLKFNGNSYVWPSYVLGKGRHTVCVLCVQELQLREFKECLSKQAPTNSWTRLRHVAFRFSWLIRGPSRGSFHLLLPQLW